MRWVGLVLLWVASGALGLHLAQQEALTGLDFALIGGWLALAIGAGLLFVRVGRRGSGGPG